MKIRPLGTQVILKPYWTSTNQQYPDTKLIVIPEDFAHELTPWGEVLAVGKKIREGLKPGDKVKFNPYEGVYLETDARAKYVLVEEQHVQAVFEEWPKHAETVEEEARELVEAFG